MNLRGKKLLLLGGAHFQVPAILAARRLGMTAICADNRPGNPGHALADLSFPTVSTVDTEAVLRLAREQAVDGVLNYGSDVSAVTCALVCSDLGLPGHDLEAVKALTNKGRFRELLRRERLQDLPVQRVLQPDEDAHRAEVGAADLPLIVKPLDSSGSKGVTRVNELAALPEAVQAARRLSRTGCVLVESFMQKTGFQICGDGFFQDGALAFVAYGNGHFHEDSGHLVPFAETFPSLHPPAMLEAVSARLQTILRLVGFGTGAFNLDVIVDAHGQPFVIEIGPRNGGNFIPQAIGAWTGVDLVEASVRAAVEPAYRLPQRGREHGFFASYMLHRKTAARFERLRLSEQIRPHVIRQLVYATTGDPIEPFVHGGHAFGNLLLRFDKQEVMMDAIAQMQRHFFHD